MGGGTQYGSSFGKNPTGGGGEEGTLSGRLDEYGSEDTVAVKKSSNWGGDSGQGEKG